jgi:hypothetical protein
MPSCEKLMSMLPSLDSPYCCSQLSAAETDALVEALGDGFGDMETDGQELPMPRTLRPGLLKHRFIVYPDTCYEENDEFWRACCSFDEKPGPWEQFPLYFNESRLMLYFGRQIDRFSFWFKSQHQQGSVSARAEALEHAARDIYSKVWYEHHAVKYLADIYMCSQSVLKNAVRRDLMLRTACGLSGELGRLVEQYYWRFRYEGAAMTGLAARKGASAGGRARASSRFVEHSEWQRLAGEIWSRRPALSKVAVADQVRKQSGSQVTAKHIARYLARPEQ